MRWRWRGSARGGIEQAVLEYLKSGRGGGLQDPRLDAEAEQLLAAADGQPTRSEPRGRAMLLVGLLLLARAESLKRPQAALPDLAATVELVGLLHDTLPDEVPAELWELAVEFGADPAARVKAARALLDAEQRSGEDGLMGLVALQRAVSDLPEDHAHCAELRLLLATEWLERFERTGEAGDLKGALVWARAALALAPAAAGRRREVFLQVLAAALTHELARDDTPENAAVTVEVCRKLLALQTRQSPDRVDALTRLGGALYTRYNHSGAAGDLDEAIDLLRSATAPGTVPNAVPRGAQLKCLASVLHRRHELTGSVDDLDETIAVMVSAVGPGGLTDAAERARWNGTLRSLRRERAEAGPQPAAARRRAPALPHQRAAEARELIVRAEAEPDPLSRDRGIELLGPALRELPEDFADRAAYSAHLGSALLARYRTGTKDPADLEAAVEFAREAVRLRHRGNPANHVAYLLVLAQAVESRYERSPTAADLASAIALYRTLLGLRPPPRGDQRWHCLHHLGKNLLLRWQQSGELSDLDAAVDALRQGLDLVRPPGEPYFLNAVNLGQALVCRQEITGTGHDLDQAHACLSAALPHLPADDELRERARHLLEVVAGRRRGRKVRQEEGIDPLLRNAEFISPKGTPEVPPEQAGRQGGDGTAVVRYDHRLTEYISRYERTGDPAVFGPALDLGYRVLGGMPDGHPGRPVVEGRIGVLLLRRFERDGDPADLDGAVEHLRRSAHGPTPNLQQLRMLHGMPDADPEELRRVAGDRVDAVLQMEPDRGGELSALAAACVRRFERDGARTDLDEAVAAAQRAVEAGRPYDGPAHCARLTVLGTALALRHRFTGESADLDRSIELGRQVLTLAGEISPRSAVNVRRSALPNLAGRLRARYLARGLPADLDEAVALGREAVALRRPGHPEHSARTNLALALWDRALLNGDPGDLDAAVTEAAGVAQDMHPASPRRAHALMSWAGMLADRSDMTREREGGSAGEDDAETALGRFAEAVQCLTAPPHERLDAAVGWGALGAKRASAGRAGWEAAADGFAAAVGLLPLTAWRGLDRGDRERLLAPRSHLASEAAACAIACGRLEEAVELLDQGRSVLWGQALDARTDLTELARAHPELARRLDGLRAGLEQGASLVDGDGDGDGDAADGTQRQRRLAREWEALVAEIRRRPGFAYFMLPLPFAELSQATAAGPMVLVNVSRYRCDALVVTPGQVRLVPLPDLDAEEAQARTERYLAAVDRIGRPGAPAGPVQQTVLDTLEWLWDTVASPVLDAPGVADRRGRRLWWCATGPLALLPVHAAGYHDPDDERPYDAVVERVVSSYMPTLRALARARRPVAAPDGPRRLLVPAVSERPGYAPSLEPLPGVRQEAEALRRRFPGRHTVLAEARATRAVVLDLLRSHSCVHFACHGGQDLADPARGALYLYDGPLTVTELARLDLESAELAVLSACQTAVGGTELPNEAIHLAGALLLGSFRQVVSTLWTVGDDTAQRVTEMLYGVLGDSAGTLHPSRAAHALHEAVVRIRREDPYRPLAWASYVHFGP
ncbi:CHAT domain-containing protein [Streptomyces sp. NPDC002209]|uniref:CHAT domain-containing protein n=1 Tax=Streptomyces sp. NPDC002209 TaxID=3364638 RepID=UPI0036B7E338